MLFNETADDVFREAIEFVGVEQARALADAWEAGRMLEQQLAELQALYGMNGDNHEYA